ncbi:MAG: RNA polymerase sigma24 factor [Actinomycetota bacterium]|nr:MAG: RNA polymerase sigma24 factor [Actinomycetota bacterium]
MIGDGFDAILAAAQRGDPNALEAIYRELAPGVLGYLRGQRAADPEDLAGEVFVAVVERIGGFRGDERAFRSWVFTIAHHRLAHARRRAARRREATVDPRELAPLGPVGDVSEEAMAALGTRWALTALDRLTPDQRDVVLLRILGGLSVEETARVLRKRRGAVKTLQRRALAALARSIEREAVSG